MFDKLTIENFKCFKKQEFVFPCLTVFVGANGMGKSTVVQSLLLIRSAKEMRDSSSVALNGPYGLELGTSASIINQDVDSNEIRFSVKDEQDNLLFDMVLEGSLVEEKLDMRRKTFVEQVNEGIMAEEFYYLSAERRGPRVSQRIVPLRYLNTGFLGEHTGQIIAKRLLKVDNERRHPKILTPYLVDHINGWLSTILPGVEVTAEDNTRMQACQIKIRNKRSMGYVESTNLGFGISYALPIIVQGLVAEEGRYYVVENPEAHLHPSAQTEMGKFLAMLAEKGLRVVIETHSDHLLDGIQIYASTHPSLRESVVIYSFGQDEERNMVINPIHMDKDCDYTSWPKGFMDQTSKNYMEFVESRNL